MFVVKTKSLKWFLKRLLELLERLIEAISSLKPKTYKVRIKFMPKVIKADHADFDILAELTALDSEGNIVLNPPLPPGATFVVTSDNEAAFQVMQDADNPLLLHCHVGGNNPDGTPANATLSATLTGADGVLIAHDSEALIITSGDPTVFTGIKLAFPSDVVSS